MAATTAHPVPNIVLVHGAFADGLELVGSDGAIDCDGLSRHRCPESIDFIE